jgi:hypothetical protein
MGLVSLFFAEFEFLDGYCSFFRQRFLLHIFRDSEVSDFLFAF